MVNRELSTESDRLNAAADMVIQQALANPGVGIPVDPDVAEHMGAFTDDALNFDDIILAGDGVDADGVAQAETGD